MASHRVEIVARGECELVIMRSFSASRAAVFRALTTPSLVSRWLLGPDGWTMPVCDIDLRVGGRYRYQWRHATAGRQKGHVGDGSRRRGA